MHQPLDTSQECCACLDLDLEMRLLLQRLVLWTSGGTTGAWNASGGHDKPGSRPPASGDARPAYVRLRERYAVADTDRQREQVVERARQEVAALLEPGCPERPEGETAEQTHKRMLREGEGWSADDVALRFRMLPREVRRLRADHGRDEYGRLASVAAPDRPKAARRMRAEGLSAREIAAALGTSHVTVLRYLRRAAS